MAEGTRLLLIRHAVTTWKGLNYGQAHWLESRLAVSKWQSDELDRLGAGLDCVRLLRHSRIGFRRSRRGRLARRLLTAAG